MTKTDQGLKLFPYWLYEVYFYMRNSLCPGCCAPRLAGAQAHKPPPHLTKMPTMCPSPSLTLHSRISTLGVQRGRTCIPERRKDQWKHPAFSAWPAAHRDHHVWCTPGSEPELPVPAACVPSPTSLRLSLGYHWPKYTGLDLKVAFVFNDATSLNPAHVTKRLFPNSCCVTQLPTPRMLPAIHLMGSVSLGSAWGNLLAP